MKKVILFFVVMLMGCTVLTTAFAATDDVTKLDDSNFDTYTMEFGKIDSIISANSKTSKESTLPDIKALNAENLELAKKMILEIDLDQYNIKGLEKYYLKQIESIMAEEEYILDYSISLPKLAKINSSYMTKSSYESFGSYNGYDMIYTTGSYTSTSRKMKETTQSKIEGFFNGSLAVAMNFANTNIGIPYSLLTSFGDEVFFDSFTEYYAVTEETNRLICIKDLDVKYGSSSLYIPTYKDEECEASGYFIFHPNVVGEGPQTSNSTSKVYGATKYYNNSSVTKRKVYDHYKRTSDGYILEYSTESPTIDYD